MTDSSALQPSPTVGFAETRPPTAARLLGIDLARGLAVFGMFTVHLGPDSDESGGIPGGLLDLAEGRSSALFAMLAGLSLVLLTGRAEVGADGGNRRTAVRVALRALILIALGTTLTMLDTPVLNILAYYGVCFLLAIPLLRLRSSGALAVVAAALALAGPVLSFLVRRWDTTTDWVDTISGFDPLAVLSGDGLVQLMVTGAYPAATWMPFVVTGMALGRLDLRTPAVLGRLAALGSALIVGGYGGSWAALRVLGGSNLPQAATERQAEDDDLAGEADFGLVNTDSPERLLVSSPHSGTTFDIAGTLGVAIIVLVLALITVHHIHRVVLLPVIAVGAMPLTVYVGHIAGIALLDPDSDASLLPLTGFILAASLLALGWRRFFRRGPLEQLMHTVTLRISTPHESRDTPRKNVNTQRS